VSDLEKALKLIQAADELQATNKLNFYKPYPFQLSFHHAHGVGEFVPVPSDLDKVGLAVHRALMAANQVGKTFVGATETAMHATGQYPDWWRGHRFTNPVEWCCSSTTNETTRDRCQRELFGDPASDKAFGTGTIPKYLLGEPARKAGVPNAWETVRVKHVSGGWSKIYLKCYEQGPKKFMGYRWHGTWCDEEPPPEIWSQIQRALLSTDGIAYITFTPEEGVTQVVHSFMNDIKPGQVLIQAAWKDAPHMTPERIKQKLETLPAHEREMRSQGIPIMGSGMVFPVPEDVLGIDPIAIPNHWPRICGVDFGWDHPFAAVWVAWDRDSDSIYVYDVYREKKETMPIHAAAINARGDWIPCVWPHDGLQHDKKSGRPLSDIYRADFKVNMLRDPFSNPPSPGQREGQGGNGVEVGIMSMLNRMEMNRFHVFKTLPQWFEEYRMYHRREGKIVAINDDLMSATRYAVQSLRFARTQTVKMPAVNLRPGVRNW
jgi:phage terminase large subunit-like protein